MSEMIPTRKIYLLADRCPEGTGKLALALSKAIPHMAPLVRNCVSHFAQKGKDGKPIPDYADLAQCHRSAAKAMAENGLVVVQTCTNNTDGEIILMTQMLHSSGEWLASYMPVKASLASPQQVAAAITYARRTSYCAMVGLAADDDDGGADAEIAAVEAINEDEVRVEELARKSLMAAASKDVRTKILERVAKREQDGTLRPAAAERLRSVAALLNAQPAAELVGAT